MRLLQLLTGDVPTTPALPVHKTPCKTSRASLSIMDSDDSQPQAKRNREDIFKAFGLSTSKAPSTPGTPVQDIIEIMSITTSPAKSSPAVNRKAKKQKTEDGRVQASSSNSEATYFTDTCRFVLVRVFGGQEETAPLERGPNGFCVAHFNGQEKESEMPNILLDKKQMSPEETPVQKKPATGKAVLKRPAKKQQEKEAEEEEEDEVIFEDEETAEAPVAEPKVSEPKVEAKSQTMSLITPVIVRVQNPTHASSGKSYIQGFHIENGREKKICVANVSGAHCQAVINDLHAQLITMKSFTKTEAQAMKDELVKKYAK